MKKEDVQMNSSMTKMAITFLLALVGGMLFEVLAVPVPWLLGPITFVLLGSTLQPKLLYWPSKIKSIGMLLIGYTIGLALTGEAVKEIGQQLPLMFGMTTLLILLSAALAYVVAKLSKINYATALLGSIPGGMTQVIVMAEEMKGINLTIVTITQTIRVLLIVLTMPLLLAFLGYHEDDTQQVMTHSQTFNWQVIFVLFLCIVLSFIGKRIKFPTAFLLVPALVTACMQGIGMELMELPSTVLQFAQLLLGIFIGLQLKVNELQHKTRTIALALLSSVLLLVTAMVLGVVFAKLNDLDLPTALLSLAPGGMDQMGAIAHVINADLSMVAGYQIFRAFFILFLIQPLLAYYLRKKATK